MKPPLPVTDGRKRRAQTSRDSIVGAMLALVAEGQIHPGAEQVASRAGVGLRTVFRHFTDMENLYGAMTATLADQYRLGLMPLVATDWRGRLREITERRLAAYEQMLPFKRAADAHRHLSAAIQAEHRAMLAVLRARLESILPPEVVADRPLLEAIDLMLSFEAWQRLRGEQHLDVAVARDIVLAQVERLAGSARP